MEERTLVEYGCESDEAEKLLCSYAELLDDWPTLFTVDPSPRPPGNGDLPTHPFRVRVRVRLRPRLAADGGAQLEVCLSVHAMLTGGGTETMTVDCGL
jgi:hypothetical protein